MLGFLAAILVEAATDKGIIMQARFNSPSPFGACLPACLPACLLGPERDRFGGMGVHHEIASSMRPPLIPASLDPQIIMWLKITGFLGAASGF